MLVLKFAGLFHSLILLTQRKSSILWSSIEELRSDLLMNILLLDLVSVISKEFLICCSFLLFLKILLIGILMISTSPLQLTQQFSSIFKTVGYFTVSISCSSSLSQLHPKDLSLLSWPKTISVIISSYSTWRSRWRWSRDWFFTGHKYF